MTKLMRHGSRWLGALVALSAAASFALPAGAAAQSANVDGRWAAWVGCWTPAAAPENATIPMLCIVPSTGASSVDFVTVRNGQETSREHVDATGQLLNGTRDGCTGWQRGEWAKDDERVYLRTDYTCPSGLQQKSSAILGMTVDGDLLDIQGLNAGKNKGVQVTRYRAASGTAQIPAAVSDVISEPGMATSAARVAASAPMQNSDIIEASAHADAPVVEAFLANRGDEYAVSAKDLEQLASGGVPGDVTDVLVALSNPRHFELNPALTGESAGYASAGAAAPVNSVATADTTRRAAECPYSASAWYYGSQCSYSPWYGFYPTAPWGGYYGYGTYPYGYGYNYGYGYGYGSPYGYPYGYGQYGGWYGGAPVIVVSPSNNNQGAGHGHLVNGRGYVSGQSSAGTSSRTSSGGSSGSAGSSGGGSTGSSGSSAGSSSGGRTAHPRTGGGGR